MQGNAWDMHVVRPIVWLIANSSLSNGVEKLALPANHEELCRALVVYFQGKGLTHLVHRKSQIIKMMFSRVPSAIVEKYVILASLS